MPSYILLLLFYFSAPAGILYLCHKNRIFCKIGPVLTLYLLGVIVANIGILRTVPNDHSQLIKFQNSISEVLVPLALPMMLFGCNFKKFSFGKSLGALAIGVISVLVAILIGYFACQKNLGQESAIIGAAMTGQYLGGAANLAALKQMLGLSSENYIILSTCNLVVSFFYLMFLMGGGVKLARKIVGTRVRHEQEVDMSEYVVENPYKYLIQKKNFAQVAKVFFASICVVGISVYIGNLFGNDDNISMIALILSITSISLILTYWEEVRTWDKSYDLGMYLIYVFCLVMATMADLSSIDWIQSIHILAFQAITIFGSLVLTVLIAKLFSIDADTAVITSDTLINSPICVPMIAATMKNKDVIVTGITNGLAGYAIGNYIGFFMFNLFNLL